jgi:hypothetical protein
MSDPTAYRWHVGSNVPGYLPEGESVCCESAIEARGVLLSELALTRDALPECDHVTVVTNGTCESCALYLATCKVIDDVPAGMNMTEGYSVAVDIGRSLPLVHWVERFDAVELDSHADCNPDD